MGHSKAISRRLRALKKLGVSAAAYRYRVKGFSPSASRRWVRLQARDFRSAGPASVNMVRKVHETGATLQSAGPRAARGGSNPRISLKEYLMLDPINKRHRWLLNRATAQRFVPGLADLVPTPYCTVFTTDGVPDIVRLNSYPKKLHRGSDGLLELLRDAGTLRIQPLQWDRGLGRRLAFDGIEFSIDGWSATSEDVEALVGRMSSKRRCVIGPDTDYAGKLGAALGVNDAVLRLYVGKLAGGQARVLQAECLVGDQWRAKKPKAHELAEARDDPGRRGWPRRRERIALNERRYTHVRNVDVDSGSIVRVPGLATSKGKHPTKVPHYADAVSEIESVLSHEEAPFNFISVDIGLDAQGRPAVQDISPEPAYPAAGGFSARASKYLTALLDAQEAKRTKRGQRARVSNRMVRRGRKFNRSYSTFRLRAEGFSGRSARLWTKRIRLARREVETSAKEREKALRAGFTPTMAQRFGIDEQNQSQFVSFRDYLFAQPLNGTYAKWVRDRVSTQKVFEPFKDFFEPIHFQVLRRNQDLQILPVSSAAKGYEPSVAGIGSFLRDHGPADLKSSAWSGSENLRLSYDGGGYQVDGVAYTDDEFEKVLTRRVMDQFYVLTESAENASQAGVFSTENRVELRVIMVNEAGVEPFVAEAFLVGLESPDTAERINSSGQLLDGSGVGTSITSDESAAGTAEGTSGSSDDEDLDAELAPTNDAAEEGDEDPGGGSGNDDIDVEMEPLVAKVERDVELAGRVDPGTGEVHEARTLIDGQLRTHRVHPLTGETLSVEVPDWDGLVEDLLRLCSFAPQLRFVEFAVVLGADGPRITSCSPTPRYPQRYPFSPRTVDFLHHEVERKAASTKVRTAVMGRWMHNAKLKVRREFAKALYPQGLVPYQSVRWLTDMGRDLLHSNGVSLKDKFWAYKQGFLSYRLPQYGITEENREDFISDLEYRWLRHINKKYKYWLEDKISIKYVAADFNDCLPAYYFFTSSYKGSTTIVPMMDSEIDGAAKIDDVLALLRSEGVLALKPDEGSHGAGFYKATFEDGGYTLNGQPATAQDIEEILCSPGSKYLVTEFIRMHPVLAEIYPNSVNTIRMVVFKKDGVTPELGNAYLRIGSVASGYVDNTAAGGMLAEIDIETGRFGHGQTLERGRIVERSHHPDTGVLIDGTIPHWDEAVAQVLAIAESLPQLEYLGFDIAITEDGIKIPEINRSPDYPRIDKLTKKTTDYLLYKLATKKKLYGYDKKRPRTLITLPERGES